MQMRARARVRKAANTPSARVAPQHSLR